MLPKKHRVNWNWKLYNVHLNCEFSYFCCAKYKLRTLWHQNKPILELMNIQLLDLASDGKEHSSLPYSVQFWYLAFLFNNLVEKYIWIKTRNKSNVENTLPPIFKNLVFSIKFMGISNKQTVLNSAKEYVYRCKLSYMYFNNMTFMMRKNKIIIAYALDKTLFRALTFCLPYTRLLIWTLLVNGIPILLP